MSDRLHDRRDEVAQDRRFLPRDSTGRRDDDKEMVDIFPMTADGDLAPRSTPASYLFMVFALLIIGVVTVRSLNVFFAPLLYKDDHVWSVGQSLSSGASYLTYDLNIETRGLRREGIRSLDERPDVAVMGASHWQEAHSAIVPELNFYNAHIHRDYYEDIAAVASWFFNYDRMPEKLIISIRDNQFAPVETRTDFLWVPVLPDYRAAASLFGFEAHAAYANGLTPRLRQAVSLPLLWDNVRRFLNAPVLPHASSELTHATLDVLLPDGGIYWSQLHRDSFTQVRAEREALSLAKAKIASPPIIDPKGVATVDRVLAFLVDQGVEVYIAHPPYHPVFWDAIQDTAYLRALNEVEKTVVSLANKYGLNVIGSFNPHEVGCEAAMYIDGEHASPLCLGEILAQALVDQDRQLQNGTDKAVQ